ncbi:DUF4412 domain-containing protein [Cyclobacterium plantarum]|uniref:DUF4412 domain-containing protein n=1 Tax=Cyclobacterium plantarum TaxID=2716263 RepID=A0ABX0HI41_9BACT|nr:DUF4412 domain-containing protein [Cyclobacterium plantarum]NHE59973.1 DUF4412 domain-containing protein [Cyclobacterium plantarum]
MKSRTSFLLIILLSLISWDAQSQLLKRIKRAASEGVSRAVERTVEKEVAKATQRQLEKAFSNLYGDMGSGENGSPDGNYDFSKIMGSINMDVETESSYSFSGLAVMEINSTDEKGKTQDPILFNSFLSENPDYFGMEFINPESKNASEKAVIIMDHKNQATVMLMDNEDGKSSMAFSIDWQGMMDGVELEEEETSPNTEDFSFEKTGNTKDILGYTCDEYRVMSDEMEGTYWLSQSPIVGMESFWSKNSPFITKKMKEENQEYFSNLPEGNILEMDFTSKEDQSRTQMKMIEIDTNKTSNFDLAEYPNAMKAAN